MSVCNPESDKYSWLLLGGIATEDADGLVLWNYDNIGPAKVSKDCYNR